MPHFTADRWLAAGVGLVHLILAAIYRSTPGISITADPLRNTWDWWWQTLSVDLLRAAPLESLWHLHAQPPLHNAFGALVINLFYPQHLEAIHTIHILLGALIAALGYDLTRRTSGNRALALVIGLGIALNPALFLFEANLLYDIITMFLLMLAVWAVGAQRRYLFAAAMTALVLTRSMYHPLLLVGVIALVAVLAGARWRRAALVATLIAALAFGWATKNAVQFGFWGTSSWTGQNIWKIVVSGYTPDELQTLADQGIIDPMLAAVERFSRPDAYRPYGYEAISDIPALAQNDYNNINIPAISQAYQAGAFALLRYDPGRYLRQAFIAYSIYSCPATAFEYVKQNAARIPLHVSLYADGLYLAGPLGGVVPLLCSVHYLVIPLALAAYLLPAVWRNRLSPRRWVAFMRADAAMLVMAGLILYTTLAGTFLEIPENSRFKLMIEPLLWVFVGVLIYRALSRRHLHEQPRTRDTLPAL